MLVALVHRVVGLSAMGNYKLADLYWSTYFVETEIKYASLRDNRQHNLELGIV
jgi:hypothetical protein